jgi:hypothetical protein
MTQNQQVKMCVMWQDRQTDGWTLVRRREGRQQLFFSINPLVVETQEGQAKDVFGVGTRRRIE